MWGEKWGGKQRVPREAEGAPGRPPGQPLRGFPFLLPRPTGSGSPSQHHAHGCPPASLCLSFLVSRTGTPSPPGAWAPCAV